ncbi:hypothetical protein pb186bvf_012179 [Paramecium bursaria]
MYQNRCQLIIPDDQSDNQNERNIYQSIGEDLDSHSTFRQWAQNRNYSSRRQSRKITQKKLISLQVPVKKYEPENDNSRSIDLSRGFRQENSILIKHNTQPSKAFSQIIVNFHSLKFARKLIQSIRPDSAFSKTHFDLIDDKASSFNNFIQPKILRKKLVTPSDLVIDFRIQIRLRVRQTLQLISNQFINIFNQIPLIEPSSRIKHFWDLVLFFIRFYLLFLIPLLMAGTNVQNLLLFLDIIIRSFTIQFDSGLPVLDRFTLISNQLNIQTFIEIIGILILLIFFAFDMQLLHQFIIGGGWPKIFMVFLYPQIRNLLMLIQVLQESLNFSKQTASVIELLKLVSLILIIQHIFSCIWIVIGQYCYDNQIKSWIDNFQESSFWNQYLQSLYYISVTMFTVGFGDISPQNSYEQIFTIVFMFLCTLQLSYSVNTIGTLITQLKENSEHIRQKITSINLYMKNKKVSLPIQHQVREYFNFYFKQEQIQKSFEQNEIVQLLPDDLRENIKNEAAGGLLYKCDFFGNFSKQTQQDLIKQIEFQSFSPGIIIDSKSLNLDMDKFICLIEQGLIEVSQQSKLGEQKKVLKLLKQEQDFGMEQFIDPNYDSTLVYKTVSFTSLLVVPLEVFKQIIKNRQEDFENYHILRANQIHQCYFCHLQKHYVTECKQIHFVSDHEKVIKRYLFNQVQDRKFIFRNNSRIKGFFNSLLDKVEIEHDAQLIQIDNEQHIQAQFPDKDINEWDGSPQQVNSVSEKVRDFSGNNYNIEQIKLQKEIQDDQLSIQFQNDDIQQFEDTNRLQPIKDDVRISQDCFEKPQNPKKQSVFNGLKTQQTQGPSTRLVQKQHSQQINSKQKIFFYKSNSNIEQQFGHPLLKILGEYQKFQDLVKIITKYNKKEQDQIWFVYKKLENNLFDQLQSVQFELMKNYCSFDVQWNSDTIFKRKYNKPAENNIRFNKYLLFPYTFWWAYKDKSFKVKIKSDKDSITKKKQLMKSGKLQLEKEKRFIRRSKARIFPDIIK